MERCTLLLCNKEEIKARKMLMNQACRNIFKSIGVKPIWLVMISPPDWNRVEESAKSNWEQISLPSPNVPSGLWAGTRKATHIKLEKRWWKVWKSVGTSSSFFNFFVSPSFMSGPPAEPGARGVVHQILTKLKSRRNKKGWMFVGMLTEW